WSGGTLDFTSSTQMSCVACLTAILLPDPAWLQILLSLALSESGIPCSWDTACLQSCTAWAREAPLSAAESGRFEVVVPPEAVALPDAVAPPSALVVVLAA